jgi:putative heme-binding domain-containing protein
VGPDLLGLTDKSPEALLIAMVDPNRAVLDQYTAYEIETNDGRSLAGMIAHESDAGLTINNAAGESEELSRAAVRSLRATGLSMMPEGLEAGLSPQDMADLLKFVASARSAGEPPPRDPGVIAASLLDDSQPAGEREAAVKVHYMLAPELLREMVRDLPVGTPEEYRRIPWIWRVTIHAGRGNDASRLQRLLELSLPKADEPLRDWQAVVIGGGLINGLSLTGVWPDERLRAVIGADVALAERYGRALSLAEVMADDTSVPNGTRYDALRMVALREPAKALRQLQRYLGADVDAELQMGAVSGLSDVRAPEALTALESALDQLTPANRQLAQRGMDRLRTALSD